MIPADFRNDLRYLVDDALNAGLTTDELEAAMRRELQALDLTTDDRDIDEARDIADDRS